MPHRANTPVCVCAHMHACLIETLTKESKECDIYIRQSQYGIIQRLIV